MNKEIKVNVEAVKSALLNAKDVFGAEIRGVEVVDPRKLTIESRFYGIEVNPIPTEEDHKDLPLENNYVAIKEHVVNSIAIVKDDTVTVNGNIDLPKNNSGVVKVRDLYFTNQEDAKEVCVAVTEVYLDRLMRMQTVIKKETDYLANQLEKQEF